MSRETVGLFSRFRNGLDMRIKRESPPDPKDRHIVPTGFNPWLHDFKQCLEIKHLAGKSIRHQRLQPGIMLPEEFLRCGQSIDFGLHSIGNAVAFDFREQFQEPA